MISTRKLAELAGVSQSTVSRSLNDKPGISPETRERIRTLARQHGYIVKKQAQKEVCLARRRAIGILLMQYDYFENLFVSQLTYELEYLIADENYYPIRLLNYYGTGGVEKLRDMLKLNLLDGLIIVNRKFDKELDQYLQEIRLPHVYLIYHQRTNDPRHHAVDTDNVAAGYMATEHLIGLGHRKIATMTSANDEFHDRTRGYRNALNDAQIPFDPSLILYSQATYESCYQTLRNRIHSLKDATALFVQFDVGAAAAINALQDLGYHVPEDFSVIGLDGINVMEILRPSLTSVCQPIPKLAKAAISALLAMTDPSAPLPQFPILLPPELIVRQSTTVPSRRRTENGK